MEEEVWKEHPVYKGYDISSHGRVRSWRTKHRGGRRATPLILSMCKQYKGVNPYPRVCLYLDGKPKTRPVHALVADVFLPPRPEGKDELNHKDGDKTNNHCRNLEWCTSSENNLHKFRLGLAEKKGERHHRAKLTDEVIRAIRREYPLLTVKKRQQFLADKYGICRPNISLIVNNKSWTHVR
ncbi:MAG: NUMOD4 motif-containing HNH endonuclease [Alphaproteobacteria bacterium]|uniref:NUMOD4 motif-containing HNH endonuclease n=1 Tax=Candidatus Nitrobium versatile TaxID=2884831 RepID=A0A953M3U1_9BACT|nr:NUMOD4 motif-containing HNH endonuclease [Candidatus Nitrobium versatile]